MKIRLYKSFEHWNKKGVIWLFSDPHFNDPDCKLMDSNWVSPEEQVKIINSKVGKNDTLIILGDINDIEYIKKLKGYKVLIKGNHDKGSSNYVRKQWTEFPYDEEYKEKYKNLSKEEIRKLSDFSYIPSPRLKYQIEFDNKLFDEVYEGPLFINENILLSHEEIKLLFGINIHGHAHSECHENVDNNFVSVNLCANVINYTPIRLDEIIKKYKLIGIHRVTIDKASN